MTLIINAPAIASNANVIRALCDDVGLTPTAVVKSAYALPEIIRAVAEGGFKRFSASSSRAASLVSRVTGEQCGLLGPSLHGPRLSGRISSVTVANPVEASRILAGGRHFVWLSTMTSDGRDGVELGRLLSILRQPLALAGPADRFGISLNWGCLGGPPSGAEQSEIRQLLSDLQASAGRLLPVSVGGSALIPLLRGLNLPGTRELRVGEALLTGNVPNADGCLLGLRSPIRMSAKVVDVQIRAGARRLLIDRGWTSIEVDDVKLRGIPARPAAASAEVSLFDLTDEARAPKLGERVDLLLGYRSTLTALLNRTIVRRVEGGGDLSIIRRSAPTHWRSRSVAASFNRAAAE